MTNCAMCQTVCSVPEGSVCFDCSPTEACVFCGRYFRSLFSNGGVCPECAGDDDDIGNDMSEYSDEDDDYERDMDESMDGDFDSAMASAGLGTDEDYGYYGSDE